MTWRCPNCNNPLNFEPPTWRCQNGHSFDQAKQGYVNLVLAHQKRSKSPGDNKAMIQARRRFLNTGYYEPLVFSLNEILVKHLADRDNQHNSGNASEVLDSQCFGPQWLDPLCLDLGCGEGYYVNELSRLTPATQWQCLDISKEAVKLAAKGAAAQYAVASSFAIPLEDASCDGVLQIFAPASDQEIWRVLRPGGILVRVGPGTDHLKELKRALYANVAQRKPQEDVDGFDTIALHSLMYSIQLQGFQLIEDLIAMTPYQWAGDRQVKKNLIEHGQLRVTLDFSIQVLKNRNT